MNTEQYTAHRNSLVTYTTVYTSGRYIIVFIIPLDTKTKRPGCNFAITIIGSIIRKRYLYLAPKCCLTSNTSMMEYSIFTSGQEPS